MATGACGDGDDVILVFDNDDVAEDVPLLRIVAKIEGCCSDDVTPAEGDDVAGDALRVVAGCCDDVILAVGSDDVAGVVAEGGNDDAALNLGDDVLLVIDNDAKLDLSFDDVLLALDTDDVAEDVPAKSPILGLVRSVARLAAVVVLKGDGDDVMAGG